MSDVFTLEGSYNLVDNVTSTLQKVQKDVNKTKGELEKQEKAWDKVKTTSGNALKKIDSFVKNTSILVGGLTGGMVALGIKGNASLESSRASWETLLGSQEKAKKMLDDITKYSATTPFSKMGVDEMAKQLNNAGYEGDALFEQLTKFGDMGGAFGIQEDSLKEMVRQYGQVQMSQTAYTEDLNILQDRGIPIYKALSETLGITVADVRKMASEGEISSEIYNKALDSIAEKSAGAMDKQSQTFNGMWSTIKDNFNNIMVQVVEPLFNKIIEVMPSIIEFFDTFSGKISEGGGYMDSLKESIQIVFGEEIYQKILDVVEVVKDLTLGYLALKTVMFVADLINGLATAWLFLKGVLVSTEVVVNGVTVAQTGLNLAFLANPITWIVLLIVGLVATFIYLWNNVDGFKEFWINAWETIKSSVGKAKDYIVEKFTAIKDKATEIFNNVRDAIKNAIETAKNFVGEQIEKIKNFFKFDWSLPKIKLPHFSIDGEFSLKPPSIPKIGVEWYSKGGIFTQPTVLGNIGVGDADNGKGSNAEAVIPIDRLFEEMRRMFGTQKEIVLNIDGREFMRATAPYQEEYEEYNQLRTLAWR